MAKAGLEGRSDCLHNARIMASTMREASWHYLETIDCWES